MLRLLLLLFALAAPAVSPAESGPRVFMIGDSTMANKPSELPEWGWGMAFPRFLKDPSAVHNHAQNGRSTKSFIAEGRWDKVRDQLKPGDFVIIQFGHNDEKVDKPAVGTDAATTFRENLARFIREIRAKQANPVLATPICRRKFDASGKLQDTHGAYPDAVRAVAEAEKAPLLDLQQATAAWLSQEGPENSRKFFMWIAPGAHPKLPNGSKDDTHLVESGAMRVAEQAAGLIRSQKLPLAALLK